MELRGLLRPFLEGKASLIHGSQRPEPMRIVFLVIGAGLLAAGGALIAFAPYYVTTGLYRAEFRASQSFNQNVSAIFSEYTNYVETGDLIALAGVIAAPIGAAMLAYGIAAGRAGEKEKQVAPVTPTTQA